MTTKLWTPADLTPVLDLELTFCRSVVASGQDVVRHILPLRDVDGSLEPDAPVFVPVVPNGSKARLAEFIFGQVDEYDVVVVVGEAWLRIVGADGRTDEPREVLQIDVYTKVAQYAASYPIDRSARTIGAGEFMEISHDAVGTFVRPIPLH